MMRFPNCERVFQFEARVLDDDLLLLPLVVPLWDFVEEDFTEDESFDVPPAPDLVLDLLPDLLFDDGTGSRRLPDDAPWR